ncbi:predicted protein [Naegleria gruberi]|uniref:intramembrane prenyl-peptidase Rce1 n=1 Tax=Naegleria gruberi TaxID=5762 RepID=D2VZQ6_NAEGR|nr:uncharacterized protein NAEGRDRAFT_74579 [Naegleria gruberi]EFC37740.1 predicted protein [Naegleria gruberi]|eukprot:XP_002670484.1 predicted protein [Naegleria gruberi strain NEG-M]
MLENSREILAVIHAIVLSALYVGSLYMWDGSLAKSRNEPSQVRRRSISVLLSSLVSIIYSCLVYLFFGNHESHQEMGLLSSMGFNFAQIHYQILAIIIAIFLNTCLFLGPIAEELEVDEVSKLNMDYIKRKIEWVCKSFVELCTNLLEMSKLFTAFLLDEQKVIQDEQGLFSFRAIVMGPLTEEIVFRTCLHYLLYYYGGISLLSSLLIACLLFGVCHCHHIIEHVVHGQMSITSALINVIVQFTYTSVFGFYCGYIYAKTSCILAAILLHAYCNQMGLPSFNMSKPIIATFYVFGLISFWILLFPTLSIF